MRSRVFVVRLARRWGSRKRCLAVAPSWTKCSKDSAEIRRDIETDVVFALEASDKEGPDEIVAGTMESLNYSRRQESILIPSLLASRC